MKFINILLALASTVAVTLGSSGGRACNEGDLQCSGGSPGGAVFACKNGAWDVLMDCGVSESCHKDPVAHCTWASAATGSVATDAVPGFKNLPAKVPTATDKDNSKYTNVELPDGVSTGDDWTSPYYNICSPCIRHNDYCKESCAWQGKDCDATCNWKTCSVNLTTGDYRQPTVSCGRFCHWPCH